VSARTSRYAPSSPPPRPRPCSARALPRRSSRLANVGSRLVAHCRLQRGAVDPGGGRARGSARRSRGRAGSGPSSPARSGTARARARAPPGGSAATRRRSTRRRSGRRRRRAHARRRASGFAGQRSAGYRSPNALTVTQSWCSSGGRRGGRSSTRRRACRARRRPARLGEHVALERFRVDAGAGGRRGRGRAEVDRARCRSGAPSAAGCAGRRRARRGTRTRA
jgi:hypothetical protein